MKRKHDTLILPPDGRTSLYVVVAYRNARAAASGKCGKSPIFPAIDSLPTPSKLLKAIRAKVIWLNQELQRSGIRSSLNGGRSRNRDRNQAAQCRPEADPTAHCARRSAFAKGDRHLTVEELHEEAVTAGVPVSLATVYNTLHQFTEAGLIRVLAVESAKTYFDTNVSDHHHFFVEGHNEVLDIPISNLTIANLPEPPVGMEIAHVDVVIRLRRKQR